jgi:hypothetical protein
MSILKDIGIAALIFLLENESLHGHLKALAEKSSNKYDDAGVEGAIVMMKRVADVLKAR